MEKRNFILMLLLAHYITYALCSNTCNVTYDFSNKNEYEKYLKDYDNSKKVNGLQDDFYKETCPCAESIVRSATQAHVRKDPDLPAKLLRLQFHDCFVRGCDASVLLKSTKKVLAEREHSLNLDISGFEVIDDIKAQVENACEGVVSCADILALAARDAVSLQYKRALWKVLTGRRDGRISNASEVHDNLPSPFNFFIDHENLFAQKGLSVRDLVVLTGAHTIGRAHCYNFDFRLWNFTSNPPSNQDPRLEKNYAEYLKGFCYDPANTKTTLPMDPGSQRSFDSHFYANLKKYKALFYSDSQLLSNGTKFARETVDELLDTVKFLQEFAVSMQRLNAIDVKTGSDGGIRKRCGFVN